MDIKSLENAVVYTNSDVQGVIQSAELQEDDLYLTVSFHYDGQDKTKIYKASVAIAKGAFSFEDPHLEEEIKRFVLEMADSKNSREEKDPLAISKSDITNKLIIQLCNNQSIALDLIGLFDNTEFENDLCSEAFEYLEYQMRWGQLDKAKSACVVVALSLIALKYYDGDLHSYIAQQYRQFRSETEYQFADTRIQKAVYDILEPYRERVCYFDPRSYVAVPIILGGVPYYRVPDLFRLAFDIYKKKLLFDEDISDEQIVDKVSETLLALKRKDLISESDTIKGTSYLIPKYTQSCIFSGVELDSLVAIISHCIRLVILRLTFPDDAYSVEKYYLEGFDAWARRFECDQKEKENYQKIKTASRPVVRLFRDTVHLVTGELLMDGSIDPNDVHIRVFANGEMVNDVWINDPNAIEYTDEDDVLGGYLLRHCDIPIEVNPLDDLSYSVVSDGHELYNSKTRLYRQVLFFDGKGNEVKPGSSYEGEIFVLSRTDNTDEYSEMIKCIHHCHGYYISSIQVNSKDIFIFDDEPFVFYKIKEARFIGYIVPWMDFLSFENKAYRICANIVILFQASCEIESLVFEVDGIKYCHNDRPPMGIKTELYSNYHDGSLAYITRIHGLPSGYHRIRIYNSKTGKQIKGSYFDFVYDHDIERDYVRKSDHSITHLYQNCFFDTQEIEFEYGTYYMEINAFVASLGHGTIRLYPSSVSYSVDGKEWWNVEERLYLCDIDDSINMIRFCGPPNMKAFYVDDGPVKSQEANLIKDAEYNTKYSLPLDYLRTINGKTTQTICFYYGTRCKYLVVRFTPYIKKDGLEHSYDSEKEEHHFSVDFEGSSMILASVVDAYTEEEICRKELRRKDEIVLPMSAIPANTRNVRVLLYGKKHGSLFANYHSVPFYRFPKIAIERASTELIKQKITVEYDSMHDEVSAKFSFGGTNTALLIIAPTGRDFKTALCEKQIMSGEITVLNLSRFPFNSYTVLLYPESAITLGTDVVKPLFVRTFKTESPVLRKKFHISHLILDDGEIIESGYSIFFAKISEVDNKYYSVCKLFNNTTGEEYYDGLVEILDINAMEIRATLLFKRDDKYMRLEMRNGKKVKGIVIDRIGSML